MYAQDAYHRVSPGRNLAPHVYEQLSPETGDTLIDFGCGLGRATEFFGQKGLRATGVDFVNVLEMDVPFVRACLWDLPDLSCDWGFCADVMEHIPTAKVDDVASEAEKMFRLYSANLTRTLRDLGVEAQARPATAPWHPREVRS